MTPNGSLRQVATELGSSGMAALGLLAAALAFAVVALRPLEARDDRLGRQLARVAPQAHASGPRFDAAATGADLDDFYRFFDTGRDTVEWLAKLYGIGKAVGLELGSGDYRLRETGTRLQRYEVTLPLAGSYSQIRAFVKNALIEIPVLALEQVSMRRERANDGIARAEVRFTLYLAKP